MTRFDLDRIMDEQELKKEILEKFGNKLDALGVKKIQFEKRYEMPEESEVSSKGGVIELLGYVRSCAVWVIKAAYHTAVIFVLMTQLPDAWKKTQVYYPNAYEVAEQIAERFESNDIIQKQRSPETAPKIEVGEKYRYIAYDPDWAVNKQSYIEDMNRLKNGDYIFDYDRKAVLIPSSTTPDYIVANSTASQYTFT